MRDSLKYVKNTKQILKRMKQCKETPMDWANLYQSLYALHLIVDEFKDFISSQNENQDQPSMIIKKIFDRYTPELQEVLSLLSVNVDFAETKKNKKVVIATGVSDRLDELRHLYNTMDNLLVFFSSIFHQFFSKISHFFFKVFGCGGSCEEIARRCSLSDKSCLLATTRIHDFGFFSNSLFLPFFSKRLFKILVFFKKIVPIEYETTVPQDFEFRVFLFMLFFWLF